MTQPIARIYRITWLPVTAVESALLEYSGELSDNPSMSIWDYVDSATLEESRIVCYETMALALALDVLPFDEFGEVHVSRERRAGRYDWEQEAYAIINKGQKTLDWIENDSE